MARFKLFLGEKVIRTFEDFKGGVEASDAVEKFRGGAIQRWLKETHQDTILERLQGEDLGKASDGRIVRRLLEATGRSPEEAARLARRIIHARNQARQAEEQAAKPTVVPARSCARKSHEPTPRHLGRPEDDGPVSGTSTGRFTLKAAFEAAVRNGDIVAVCRDLPKGLWRQTQGGRLNWSDLASCDGWRLQINDNVFVRQFGNHCRVLDPTDIRHGFGVYSKIELVFRRYWDSLA